jgi:hypothetical protein
LTRPQGPGFDPKPAAVHSCRWPQGQKVFIFIFFTFFLHKSRL